MIHNGYIYVFVCASYFGLITMIAKMTGDENTATETVAFFVSWAAL
tara:strand:- start:334 stop:471 length:138 start_codon:yes stop_codon:yes gene_type:complete